MDGGPTVWRDMAVFFLKTARCLWKKVCAAVRGCVLLIVILGLYFVINCKLLFANTCNLAELIYLCSLISGSLLDFCEYI